VLLSIECPKAEARSWGSGVKPEERLIDPTRLGAWRKRIGLDVPVAVVTGTFDVLQPGNLSVLRRARVAGGPVLVVLEPDEVVASHASPGRPQNPQAIRAEMVAHLRKKRGRILTIHTYRDVR
jgi:bifunctional ADP-heptose synthase (sugar kinase/adenylyltransferase)